ncbi:uncharacterized protein CTRU02_206597 [Colletotrichum truncatum]|uniref:Uncharacterized protein n=1 Tax=Colletotrichum truncatum TaxID=5467 RepID=A0ACC3Z7E6_COLTU|nr:uncharacterized protein CTRU02_11966 [Colletotrichum truncatum]KAF6785341.1 hypothetical protein CTRU02_11966 [Colletotrichum truncatum]
MSEIDPSRPDITAFMARASADLGTSLPPAKDVSTFGDNPALADELLEIVLQGNKTSTTNWPIPDPLHWAVGDLSVILDGKGQPRAIIRTTSFVRCKFKDVEEDFALAEGEGDYDEWRQEHIKFFKRQDAESFNEEVEVLCERFEVVYPVLCQNAI